MQIVILLFPGFTPLDALGPYHVLGSVPGADVAFVAERVGLVDDQSTFSMQAHASIDDVDHADVLVVPGGLSAITIARDGGRLIDWIGEVHHTTTWTTSVCTGALMLGAAGVLEGRRATTHWYSVDDLAAYGAEPVHERWVEDGNVITSAGVSAGIDMSLHLVSRLAGRAFAEGVQLDMEYDPSPPFNSGHPRTASPATVAALRADYDRMLGR